MGDWNMVLWTAVFFVVCCPALWFYTNHKEKKEEKTQLLKNRQKLEAEQKRIAAFKKLDTRWLMPVPPHVTNEILKEAKKPAEQFRRCWNNRGEYLLIFDHAGQAWFGYVNPVVFNSLREGEYVQEEKILVPLRGKNERLSGKPKEMDGDVFDVYPSWFNDDTPQNKWERLIGLRNTMRLTHQGKTNHEVLSAYYPRERRYEAAEKRRLYDRLVSDCQLSVE